MLVREALQERLASADRDKIAVRLPNSLKRDLVSARSLLVRRLALGGGGTHRQSRSKSQSSETMKGAGSQRVIVKAQQSPHNGLGKDRIRTLLSQVRYLSRDPELGEGRKPTFFDRQNDRVSAPDVVSSWQDDPCHYRLIVSPEHSDRIADMRGYVREMMKRVSLGLADEQQEWISTCHFDTVHPHAHVLLRGRRADGRDLRIDQKRLGLHVRAVAQDVAGALLGDLTRSIGEQRVWSEARAERFTGLDRRLIAAADEFGRVPDGIGESDAWAVLRRSRLRTLEALGLAQRAGEVFQLDPSLETKLRQLQHRKEAVRAVNQRQLDGGGPVEVVTEGKIAGEVVSRGYQDELGARAFVIVRTESGQERYAQLPMAASLPDVGQWLQLDLGSQQSLGLRPKSADLAL